jgi:hypothetical protein
MKKLTKKELEQIAIQKTLADQAEMIKKYHLGRNDRSIIITGGIAGSTGVFNRIRYANAVKKLIKLGLLTKVPTKYGFDYLLTSEGWGVHSKIYSNA